LGSERGKFNQYIQDLVTNVRHGEKKLRKRIAKTTIVNNPLEVKFKTIIAIGILVAFCIGCVSTTIESRKAGVNWLESNGIYQKGNVFVLNNGNLWVEIYDKELTSLEFLSKVNIERLDLSGCTFPTLTPLRHSRIKELCIIDTNANNLEPLKNLPLIKLYISGSPVCDLSPLAGMELRELIFSPSQVTNGIEVIRSMKSLKRIGINPPRTFPASEFWERMDNDKLSKNRANVSEYQHEVNPFN